MSSESRCYVKASYTVAMILAKSKPFPDDEMVKECLKRDVEILCPEMKKDISNLFLSLSPQTITMRIDDIRKHVEDNLKSQASEFILQ